MVRATQSNSVKMKPFPQQVVVLLKFGQKEHGNEHRKVGKGHLLAYQLYKVGHLHRIHRNSLVHHRKDTEWICNGRRQDTGTAHMDGMHLRKRK